MCIRDRENIPLAEEIGLVQAASPLFEAADGEGGAGGDDGGFAGLLQLPQPGAGIVVQGVALVQDADHLGIVPEGAAVEGCLLYTSRCV